MLDELSRGPLKRAASGLDSRWEVSTMGLLRLTHERPEITPDVTVREAVQVMVRARVGAIAVKERSALVGIFTERDLMRRVVAENLDPDVTPIRDVMTTNIVTVIDSTPVA